MPRHAQARTGNLPTDLTSFVGRRGDTVRLRRLLSDSRLVTLTGTGGVGKTRLALSVARQVGHAFPGGVWLVRLDLLRDESLLAQTIAATLDLTEQPGRTPDEVVAEHLSGRGVLLVLDNCEHLVDAVAKLTDRLLRTARDLRILATSREPLDVGEEAVVRVSALSTPDPRGPLDRAEVLRSDAVALFAQRAAAVQPGFEVTDTNQASVVRICHLVEGLPLAIELSAAWLQVLTPAQIGDRLSGRLALLNRGNRAATDRQQTLRGCIDWTYELCTDAQRRLWARLSVFAAGFDLDAVAYVCDDGQAVSSYLTGMLTALISKSVLIREDDDPAATRYRMLETLREYGADRLAEMPEHERTRRQHRDHYAAMAARAEAAWTGPEQLRWARTLTREHANVQVAMEYCLRDPAEVAAAQELGARLWFFWVACGFLREGRYYLDRAITGGGGGAPRRWALWACAFVSGSMSDLDTADKLAAQCHADAVAAGDRRFAAYADDVRALTLALRGDFDGAIELMQQTLSYYHGLDHVDVGQLRTQPMLGVTLVMRGDHDAALALAPLCEELCERLGERWQRSYVHYFVGVALRGNHDATRAVRYLTTAIETKYQFHDIFGLIMCFEQLAGAHADLGAGERAAHLLGAVEQLQHSYGLQRSGSPFHSAEHQRAEQHARSLLGTSRYEAALRRGRTMDLDTLVAFATSPPPPAPRPGPVSHPPAGDDPLTHRERQVADLVGQGLTNREIASRLVVSVRTAESHVQNALTKLGFTSRNQLAAWITARPPQADE